MPVIEPDRAIHDSRWCCARDLRNRSSRRYEVKPFTPAGVAPAAVDWSYLFPGRQTRATPRSMRPGPNTDMLAVFEKDERGFPVSPRLRPEPSECSGCWNNALALCALVMRRLDRIQPHVEKQPSTQRFSWIEMITSLFWRPPERNDRNVYKVYVVDGKPVLKMSRPDVEVVKELVAKHPVVTSLRCLHLDNDDGFHLLESGEGTWYCGGYNLYWIEHCVLLLGYTEGCPMKYDPGCWIVLHPERGIFRVSRSCYTGVGEFILLPLAPSPETGPETGTSCLAEMQHFSL